MRVLSIEKYNALMKGTASLPVSYRQMDDLYWPSIVPTLKSATKPVWPSGGGFRAYSYYFLYLVSDMVPGVIIFFLIASSLYYLFAPVEPRPLLGVPTEDLFKPRSGLFGTDANYALVRFWAILASLVASFAAERYFRWWRVGRKNLLTRDPRPPVLVLRRFSPFGIQAEDVETYGEHLDINLKPYGPVISLKNESQKQPPRGPYSLEVDDSEWQAEVLSYLERSVAIIVFAGLSKGLVWELNEIAERGLLYRTALVIPSGFNTRDFGVLKCMLAGATIEGLRKIKELEEVMPLAERFVNRPEFQIFWQNEIHQAHVIRWTLDGEPVVFTGRNSTPEGIVEALLLSIHFSRHRSAREK